MIAGMNLIIEINFLWLLGKIWAIGITNACRETILNIF